MWPAEVIANRPLSADYNVLALAAPAIAAAADARTVRDGEGGHAAPTRCLRRPFSVFEVLRDSAGSPAGDLRF